jgi:hypothetical protein
VLIFSTLLAAGKISALELMNRLFSADGPLVSKPLCEAPGETPGSKACTGVFRGPGAELVAIFRLPRSGGKSSNHGPLEHGHIPAMKLSKPFCLVLGVSTLLLAACSSGPQVNSAVLSAATTRGVAPSTEQKMSNARPLALDDLENLVSKGVPSQTIISYLTSIRQTFHYTPAQLAALQSNGADTQLLAYLRESGGFYNPSSPAPGRNRPLQPAGQYTNSRGYQDEQPFAYNEPGIDGFYNSAYEESLYSPFSMN